MNRRKFLGMMVGGVAAGAAVRTWPFRVYSFPSPHILTLADVNVTGFGFNIPENARVTGISFKPIAVTDYVPLDRNGFMMVEEEILRVIHYDVNNGYSCNLCGLEKVHCDVAERETGTDIGVWIRMVGAILSEDHARRSPDCHPLTLSEVYIPITGAQHIGGPAVQ